MSEAKDKKRRLPTASGWLLMLALVLLHGRPAWSQVIDDHTDQDTTWTGVGADSADFAAQSFIADVNRVRKFGVWLQRASGTAEVRIALMRDTGTNLPDMNFILEESALQVPDTGGGWVWDSTFSAVLTPGTKYWVVVDGYNNLQGSGYASVGLSNTYTDSGDPFRYTTDNGTNWFSIPTNAMAIHVEGDSCVFNLAVTPQQPLLCPDESVQFGVPNGYVSYAWSNGLTSAAIWANTVGLYTVTVVDTNNCTAIASVLVVAGIQPTSSLMDDYETCANVPLALALPPFYSSYLWSTGATGSRDTLTQSGTYWVRMVSTSGCTASDTFEVVVHPLPQVDVGQDDTLCIGDTLVLDAGAGYTGYTWSTGEFSQTITLTQTTTAWVRVQDSFMCEAFSDTAVYSFYPDPAIPIIQVEENLLHSSFSNYFQWTLNGQTLPGETNQDLLNPQPGSYTVIITNAYGCSAESDTVMVVAAVEGDFVSEAISPNGDGMNDFFFVEGIGRYPELNFMVFDRWGNEIYRANPYQNDWYGTGKGGDPLPVGDYFFILEFGGSAGREAIHGNLLIGR
jgi:gliding motility-associated-like protein